MKWSLQQLCTVVIPEALCSAVISAVYVAPTSGHLDAKKMLWRAMTQFWWPNMAHNMTNAVKSCIHCQVINLTSHQVQQKLKAVMTEAPFDVYAIDV